MREFIAKRKEEASDESGAVAVLVAFCLVIMLAFAALAIDFGAAYAEGSRVQTACDAASLAAASKYDPTKVGCDRTANDSAVRTEAKRIMKANGYTIQDCDVIINSVDQTVEVKKQAVVKTTFAQMLNIKKLSSPKSAIAAVGAAQTTTKKFTLDYALFSSSTSMGIPVNGSVDVYGGDVHTNYAVEFSSETNSDMKIEGKYTYAYGNGIVNPSVGGTLTGMDSNHNNRPLNSEKTGVEEMPDYHDSILGMYPSNPITNYISSLGINPSHNVPKPSFSNRSTYPVDYNTLDDYISAKGNTVTGTVRVGSAYTSQMVTVTGDLIIYGGADFRGYTVVNGGSISCADTMTFTGMSPTVNNGGKVCSIDGLTFGNPGTYGVVSIDGYVTCVKQLVFNYQTLISNAYKASVAYSVRSNIQYGDYGGYKGTTDTFNGLIYVPNGEFLLANDYSIQVNCGGVIAKQINTSKGALAIYYDNDKANWDMQQTVTGGTPGADPSATKRKVKLSK